MIIYYVLIYHAVLIKNAESYARIRFIIKLPCYECIVVFKQTADQTDILVEIGCKDTLILPVQLFACFL
jgi:hypothetical protein